MAARLRAGVGKQPQPQLPSMARERLWLGARRTASEGATNGRRISRVMSHFADSVYVAR